jgi:hypothetical protein
MYARAPTRVAASMRITVNKKAREGGGQVAIVDSRAEARP